MIRIFLPPDKLSSENIVITGENARHLSLVLRVKPGEAVVIFDGQGNRYECNITSVHKKEVAARLLSKAPYSVESPVLITLAQGLPKGDKMDFIIQKSTELGVHKIIPLFAERSQVHHTHKVGRWRKIALSASEQSGRDKVPEIAEPVDLHDYLDQVITPMAKGYIEDIKGITSVFEACILLSEESKERNLKEVLANFKGNSRFSLLVGPEGGFAKEEVAAAVERGFMEVSLGPRILRTETAPIAALSIIQYELGDVGE